jgi:hypothetical protein
VLVSQESRAERQEPEAEDSLVVFLALDSRLSALDLFGPWSVPDSARDFAKVEGPTDHPWSVGARFDSWRGHLIVDEYDEIR